MASKIMRRDTVIGTRYVDGSWDSVTYTIYTNGEVVEEQDHNEPSREIPEWMGK